MSDYQADARPLDKIEAGGCSVSLPPSHAGNNYTFIYGKIFESGKKYTLSGILIFPYGSGGPDNDLIYQSLQRYVGFRNEKNHTWHAVCSL
jgi:hypothetical protein